MNAPVFGTLTGTPALTENDMVTTHTVSGTLPFTDTRPSGSPAINFQAIQPVVPVGTAIGTLTANISDQALGSGDEAGVISWSYSVTNAAIDYLAAGEQRIAQFQVTLVDADGQSSTETISITITGTNDGPVFSSGPATSSFGEDGDLTSTGTLVFNDVDTIDTHSESLSVTVSGGSMGLTLDEAALKSLLTLTTTSTVGSTAGSVAWSFAASAADFQFLDTDDTLTLTYTVAIDDGHGGTAQQTITVNITGSNDAPILTVGSGTIADTAANDTFADLTGFSRRPTLTTATSLCSTFLEAAPLPSRDSMFSLLVPMAHCT